MKKQTLLSLIAGSAIIFASPSVLAQIGPQAFTAHGGQEATATQSPDVLPQSSDSRKTKKVSHEKEVQTEKMRKVSQENEELSKSSDSATQKINQEAEEIRHG